MTSREIAELVESRHDNVKRTVDTLSAKGAIPFPQAEEKATAGISAVSTTEGRPPPGVLGVAFLKRPPWRANMEAACGDRSVPSHECRLSL